MLQTLEAFAVALAIVGGVVAWALMGTHRWWSYDYEISGSGIRVMIFKRLCWCAIPVHRIASVRILGAPSGYMNGQHPLWVLHLEDFAMAPEGVSVTCTNGIEFLLTPKDSRDFMRRVVTSGMPGEMDPDGRLWSRREVRTA